MVMFGQYTRPNSKHRTINPNRIGGIVFFCILLVIAITGYSPVNAELDLADTPMMALVKSPPANLMFVLDDSGSMTCDILIENQYDGRYPSPIDMTRDKENGFCYVFDYLGDHAYEWNRSDERDSDNNLRYMLAEYRKFWRSQYFGENIMYYNPRVQYDPWPGYGAVTFPDADKENPKTHPTKGSTLDLDASSFSVILITDAVIENSFDVKHAHYYDKSVSGDIYLVVIDGAEKKIKYYKVMETADAGFGEEVTKIEEVKSYDLPDGIAKNLDYDNARQNFANWFTYHRKREYVAKMFLAKVIKSLSGVRVGLLSINGKIIVPLKPVDAAIGGIRSDDRDIILEKLYRYDSQGETPLREGLNDVGRYFRSNSTRLIHFGGGKSEKNLSPYFPNSEGGACQQCFSIIMTDGYYSTTGEINVANADGSDNPTDFDRSILADDLSYTLADIAMYYYENDLSPESVGEKPGLSDLVPIFGFDRAKHQHMVTFGVTFGLKGNIDPDDYGDKMNLIYEKDDRDEGPVDFSIPWPREINIRQADTLDDLYHATLNSRGQLFSSDNPRQLTDTLLKLTEDRAAPISGSASAVSVSGNQLYEAINAKIRLFQCSYRHINGEWTGDVKAYGFSEYTGILDPDIAVWSAAEALEAKHWSERNIATYNPEENEGSIFDYDNFIAAQKIALGWDGVADSDSEASANDRVDYIRGKEIDGFRSRSQKLGDIVHSDPVYENGVVYAGANDGMLHAFNATEFAPRQATDPEPGEELFAYIPNLVFENLAELTKSDYHHKYFVDLTPTVFKGAGLLEGQPPNSATGVQTMVIGGLGKGGKGYFALDVSDPFSMDTAEQVARKVLWEFSVEADGDMGYSFSKPVVVRSYDKNHPWIVIVGNGYNSQNGHAVLYILNPTKKPGQGLLIKKLAMKDSNNNGLSSPTAVDVNFDHVVDYVYAGDLNGNLWKVGLDKPLLLLSFIANFFISRPWPGFFAGLRIYSTA